jgi:hypothetical protein
MASSALAARSPYFEYKRALAYDSWEHNEPVNMLRDIWNARVPEPATIKGVYNFIRYSKRELTARDARGIAGHLFGGKALAPITVDAGTRVVYRSKDTRHAVHGIVIGQNVRRGMTYYQVLVAPAKLGRGKNAGFTLRNVRPNRVSFKRGAAQF